VSDALVIADVSDTLLKLLRDQMSALITPDHITLASPAEVELDTSPWLTLYLYQIGENPHLKNEDMLRLDATRMQHPPLTLDLYYLVVAYAQSRDNEHQLLGRVLQIFASQPVMRGSWLQGSLSGTSEELRVTYHTVAMEDMLRLWNAFNNKPYKLSIAYQVTPVRIDSARPPLTIQPIVERTVQIQLQDV
jgi:hypothetical protein